MFLLLGFNGGNPGEHGENINTAHGLEFEIVFVLVNPLVLNKWGPHTSGDHNMWGPQLRIKEGNCWELWMY